MKLQGVLSLLQHNPTYRHGLQRLQELYGAAPTPGTLPVGSMELLRAARPPVLAALQQDWPGPIVVLTGRPEQARHLNEQLQIWSNRPEAVHYYSTPDTIYYDRTAWDRQTVQSRIAVLAMLEGLSRGETDADSGTIITAPVWSVMTKTLPPMALRRATHTVTVGMVLPMYDFLTDLVRAGYDASVVVEQPGTFSHRGSIVEVFPPNMQQPVRIDFFGDEVDSVRTFDPGTQRSIAALQKVTLSPASEALPEWGMAAAERLQAVDLTKCNSRTRQHMAEELETLSQGGFFEGLEHYIPYLYPRPAGLLDYLPDDTLLLIDDLLSMESAAVALEEQAASLRADLIRDGDLPETFPVPYYTWKELSARLGERTVFGLGYHAEAPQHALGKTFVPAPTYAGQLQDALAGVQALHHEGHRVVIVTRQAERLSDLMREQDLYVTPTEALVEAPPAGALSLVESVLAEGFAMPAADLTLLTDAEIFGWVRQRRRRPAPVGETAPEALFADLKEGDYVVHIEYGIGRYHGMVRKTMGSQQREYMEIEYDAGDRLFVPIHHADRVNRYLGADDREPRIHRLGGTEWATVRERAERAVRDIARELLELYALRETAQGHAFARDTVWQHEMEAAFPYVETDDQLQALAEVKNDMEEPKPMDRLLVGDVGYGKTEVAIRAAFKAVMDGKQVAVLVPTTVLAQQHFHTFRRRLRAFPIVVEMLSRFRNPAEQDEIIRGLRRGHVDIVIGTHRLLSRDVSIKDLGLLVVDEEQRFGVVHKERIKQLRREVDVLTMTATPIPRTLYMSLSGIRDMSVIDTPPENRLAVKTTVTARDEHLIRRAILRELDRGGQVYFVHNRVQDIELVAAELQRIAPEASVVIGHGQMPEDELAQVMLGFAQGEGDVLLCTTIIENGLDIPNVNTIIIDRADRFGLAQLYQLRGRVGRGVDRSYAYLLFKPPLTEIARQRLQTIQEASELGAGFRVAMRDMEIRGAGEILGAEQHGHITAVGFDLYARLLRRAIEELKEGAGTPEAVREAQASVAGEALTLELGPSIDLPVSAYLPPDYIPDDALRLRLYRRLARVQAQAQIDSLIGELSDRFGELPGPVRDLLYVLRLRVLGTEIGIESLRGDQREISINLPMQLGTSTADMITAQFPHVRARGTHVRMPTEDGWRDELLNILEFLTQLAPSAQHAAA